MRRVTAIVTISMVLLAMRAFAQVPGQIPLGTGGTITFTYTGNFSGTVPSIASGVVSQIGWGVSLAALTESNAQYIMPYNGNANGLYCVMATASSGAGPTVTLRINTANSGLAVTCAAGATTCSTTGGASFTAGQILDFRVDNTLNANATGIITCGTQLS